MSLLAILVALNVAGYFWPRVERRFGVLGRVTWETRKETLRLCLKHNLRVGHVTDEGKVYLTHR